MIKDALRRLSTRHSDTVTLSKQGVTAVNFRTGVATESMIKTKVKGIVLPAKGDQEPKEFFDRASIVVITQAHEDLSTHDTVHYDGKIWHIKKIERYKNQAWIITATNVQNEKYI